jgi:hypothetical protein
MRNFYAILILAFSLSEVRAAENFCEALNLINCDPIHKMTRRSSAKSLPSSGTAAQFNPSNVSHDRGVGLETFYQPSQSPSFNFVTGTGKAGAALVSSKLENAFFGNRVPEIEEDYLERIENKEQYKSNKYTLALGVALFKRRNLGLDLGVLTKYNEKTKRMNPGGGLAMRIGPVSLGASVYKDDFFLKTIDYQETFTVQNYFAGIQIKNLFLDAGVIKTHYKFYDDDSEIKLYSASYIWNKLLFNLAYRIETVYEKDESEIYAGLQYSLNKYLILGVHYNYYLLDEMAGSLTIFF